MIRFEDILDTSPLSLKKLNDQLRALWNKTMNVGNKDILDNAVSEEKVTDGAITTNKIADAAITNAKIDNLSVTSAKIADASIDSAKIQDAAITNAKIADAAITNAKIANASIDSAKIQDGAITNAKIANATIDNAKIADAAISTAKIQTGAITTALISTGAVQTAQIADASITDAKIVDLTANKITSGSIDTSNVSVHGSGGKLNIVNNKLNVVDNNNKERVVIGDVNSDGSVYGIRVRGADGVTVLLDETGVKSEGITDGTITESKIADNAVTTPKIINNAITADKIVASAVTADKIAANAVTATKIAANTITAGSAIIADGAITNAKIASLDAGKITTGTLSADRIAAGSITGDKIAAGAITADKIAAGAITADKIYAQTLSGITLTGVTLRSTGDTWIGHDIYLYGDNQGYTGGSIYFGITDPPALAPLIYGYEDGTRNNLDFYVTNGTITFETMQFNLNCNIYTTGDVYCYDLYATSRVMADTVISGTVQTDRLQGKRNSEVIYIGPGTCLFDVYDGSFRIKQSSTNYMRIDTNGQVTIFVNGTAKHIFRTDGTKTGGTIELEGVNYGMSPIDNPEYLISDIIRQVPIKKGHNIIKLDDTTAKAIDGYSVFFENGNGITVKEKNPSEFMLDSQQDSITDIFLIGTRKDYKGVRWEVINE